MTSGECRSQNSFLETQLSNYYLTLREGDLESIKEQIVQLQFLPAKDTLAFAGAMKMKLAGMLSSPAEKLKTFRIGRNSLELAIDKDSSNAEYRFLRLVIQENAPSILGYRINLKEDKELILKNFKLMPKSLQKEIRKYALSSKVIDEISLTD